jgi:hypothetical protein
MTVTVAALLELTNNGGVYTLCSRSEETIFHESPVNLSSSSGVSIAGDRLG